MAKKLDLNKSVYELTTEYPELIDILAGIGFTEITKKAMLNSVGKMTTIPKGAKMRGIPMMKVVGTLMANGFELVGEMPKFGLFGKKAKAQSPNDSSDTLVSESADTTGVGSDSEISRRALLKDYLKRLGAGEDLEAVRADFVANFSDVEASEIMQAEQELIKEGTPITEVQKLCDVHSALFHGATREEKIANAEKAVEESVKKQNETSKPDHREASSANMQNQPSNFAPQDNGPKHDPSKKLEIARELSQIIGHPLYLFGKENVALEMLLVTIKGAMNEGNVTPNLITKFRELAIHYAKKGDLLYPHLKVKYEISGPSDVMWTVDDEIRDEIASLSKTYNYDDLWMKRLGDVVKRAEEMIYKEKNILFPICAVYFSDAEWYSIYQDSKDYAQCLGVPFEKWEEAENSIAAKEKAIMNGEIVMPGGHMTVEQLTALLNTIPLEISFVDDQNINRFFNEGPKVFKRPGMAIDREVFSCHPPKIEPMVRSILDSFRDGSRDSVPVWMEKQGRTMLVTYMAVRDQDKKYLGTMELVQDMEFAKEHFASGNNNIVMPDPTTMY